MWRLDIPDDATAEETAAAMAVVQALLGAEGAVKAPASMQRWVRTARLEAQGLRLQGNELTGWRVRSHV